jgi:hypothetical protein
MESPICEARTDRKRAIPHSRLIICRKVALFDGSALVDFAQKRVFWSDGFRSGVERDTGERIELILIHWNL